jgi:hypothetical protein
MRQAIFQYRNVSQIVATQRRVSQQDDQLQGRCR